jgi:hypothetical protein
MESSADNLCPGLQISSRWNHFKNAINMRTCTRSFDPVLSIPEGDCDLDLTIWELFEKNFDLAGT